MKSITCRFCGAGALIAGLFACVCLFGCEVTPDKIDIWKASENGPPKLRAAVRDTDQKLEVRILAARALAELGHFGPLREDFAALQQADREQVVRTLVEKLIAQMRGSNDRATTRLQEQAKDALFELRPGLEGKLRGDVDMRVVRWLLADWAARRRGDHSGEKIVTTVGAGAGPLLAQQVAADPAVVTELAALIRQVGSVADRDAAARRLIALAKQQGDVQPATLEALGRLQAAAGRAYLLGRARQAPTVAIRGAAMQALALDAQADLVEPLLAIAADAKEDGDLRERAFEVLEKVRGPKVLQELSVLLAAPKDVLRYRTAEALVACCGVQGVAKLLAALPSRYNYPPEDVKDYLERDIRGLGAKALPAVREAVQSRSWIARLVAVRVLGDLGTKEDLARLEPLTKDATRLRGWPRGASIGSEARAAMERLQKRVGG